MWNQYFIPDTLDKALSLLQKHVGTARVIAGGTDLILDFSNRKLPPVEAVVDITTIPDLKKITVENGVAWVGNQDALSRIYER